MTFMAKHEAQRVLRPAEHRRGRSRYVAALDGLRTFAVMAVIFYHMSLNWAPGGLMGVTVFFVISGYLINGLLVSEYQARGTISLSRFWLRRVRRIVPAVLLALAGTLVLCALMNPALFAKARSDLVPSLLFFNNWWQVFRDVSYFEAAAAPSPLTHYWSLAIEEQFYIVWPLLVLALLKARIPRKGMAGVVAVLAVLSFVEMALLYSPTVDPSRIYYGTDTRAGSLMIGALLALVWPSTIFGHRRAQPKTAGGRLLFNLAGVGALAGLVAIIGFTKSYTPFPYFGGIALVSLLTAVLIAVLVVPYTWMARLFQLGPLAWIGKRSYGMYLWHYPIILATTNPASTVAVPWWVRLSQIVIIVAVADLSYRFVEMPIRAGALRAWWQGLRAGVHGTGRPGRRTAGSVATVAACAALACAAGIAVAVMPPASSAVPQGQVAAVSAQGAAGETPRASTASGSTASADAPGAAASADAPGAAASANSERSGDSASSAGPVASAGSAEAASSSTSPGAASSDADGSASSAGSESQAGSSVSVSVASAGSESASGLVDSTGSDGASASSSSAAGSSSSTSSTSSDGSTSSAAPARSASSGNSESSAGSANSAGSAGSASSASAASSARSTSSTGSASSAGSASSSAARAASSQAFSVQSETPSQVPGVVAVTVAAVSDRAGIESQKLQEMADEQRQKAAAIVERLTAGDPDAAETLFAQVASAVDEQIEALSDEERAQAENAVRGRVEYAAATIAQTVDEAIVQVAEQRRQEAYDQIFGTAHLNEGGGIVYEPLLIGDSVAAGCENEFYRVFPNGHSDAQVSRNIWESTLYYYVATKQVGEYVVFCLGTNNAVTDEQVDEMLADVPDETKVVIVNVRCPRDWEAQTNAALAAGAQRHANVVAFVDWYSASAGHDEYFYEDGIHLNEVGSRAYIGLIQDAIMSTIG